MSFDRIFFLVSCSAFVFACMILARWLTVHGL